MTLIQKLFDGTDGVDLSNANIGSTQVTKGAGPPPGTAKFSSAHPHNGSTGAAFAGSLGAATNNSIARFNLNAANNAAAFSMVFWYPGTPTDVTEVGLTWRNSGGIAGRFGILNNGKLAVTDTAGTNKWTSTAALPSSGSYRFNITPLVGAASTGTFTCAYYAGGDSTTPIETSALISGIDFGSLTLSALDVGRIAGSTITPYTWFIDTLQFNDGATTFIPPYVVSSVSYVSDFTGLRAAGYTGTLSDMRRQNYLALLSLSEPQFKSNNDLELQYWRSVGKTGSLMDARHQS